MSVILDFSLASSNKNNTRAILADEGKRGEEREEAGGPPVKLAAASVCSFSYGCPEFV